MFLSGMWLVVALIINIKRHVFKRDWSMCSKYDNRYRLKSLFFILLYFIWGGGAKKHLRTIYLNLQLPNQPIYGQWMISPLHWPHLTHSFAIKITINIEPTWISSYIRHKSCAICRWLEYVKICQSGKWSCFCCVGSSCKGVDFNQ